MRCSKLIMGALCLSLSASAWAKDVAVVNGDKISADEFKEAVKQLGPRAEMLKQQPQARSQFLDQIITVRLLEQAARKEKIQDSKAFKERMGAVEKQILASVYVEQEVDKKTSDKAMKDYFEKNKEQFSDKQVCAQHILLKEDDKKKAEDVLKKAKAKKADFAKLAQEHSTGPSAPKGGDLGCFGPGQMVPEFEKAAFATKKDTVHGDLVQTQFGYHIIKVNDIKGSDKVAFKDIKEKVRSQMQDELQREVLEGVRKDAKITINEKELESIKL